MDIQKRIERGLERATAYATAAGQPAKISEAIRYAIFPGGARVRPRLCQAVAVANGDRHPAAADAAATAIELLHCASLVHDDLPCFDDATERRGKPSVHAAFGEPIALLTGDALIVLAFETIARECALTSELIAPLIVTVGRAVGMPHGIVAGQAWESETDIPLKEYHRTKTGALFSGATAAGAISGGADPQEWLALGETLGAAYQVADDLRDLVCDAAETGKPAGQDAQNQRPNAGAAYGIPEAIAQLQTQVARAVDSIPDCAGAPMLRQLIKDEATRLVPKSLAQHAA
jgi:geranylgeranyl diphosphate synthase type II